MEDVWLCEWKSRLERCLDRYASWNSRFTPALIQNEDTTVVYNQNENLYNQ